MIEIQDLQKSFGDFHAVDGVSFSVEPGEVLGFLGPNGAGKSTTMRMITGFLTPTGGAVKIGGVDVCADPISAKRRIGYLPEGAPLYPDMTPRTLLEFIAEVRGVPASERKARIAKVVAQVHISGVLDQTIDTLSKGFKRRVGLAQAILHDPEILILDEPTDGLDPNQKHEVRQLIREMSKDKVIILSTHILEEVDSVCTRAIIITRGKVVFDGTPGELKERSPSGRLDDVFREITTAAAPARG
jgi:ABC-2 type transport system ATP-binding protein